MDSSPKTDAKNIMARTAFFALLAAYLTGAVITSLRLPIESEQNIASSKVISAVVANVKTITNISNERYFKPFFAALQNKDVKSAGGVERKTSELGKSELGKKVRSREALAHGKWWREHRTAISQIASREAETDQKTGIIASINRQEALYKPALIADVEKHLVMDQLRSVFERFKENPPSVLQPLRRPKDALRRNALPRDALEPPTVKLAGLSLTNSFPLLHPVMSDYGDVLVDFLGGLNPDLQVDSSQNDEPKSSIAPLEKARTDQCIEEKVAGWFGTKLLAKHKELLRQSSPVSQKISARLKAKGIKAGAPVYMRIFKDSSLLEVWLEKEGRYVLFETYKICRWSGSFGPKLYEGDRQSPEGFYLVDDQLFNRHSWKWKGSFSIGYPNAYDKLHGRTGSLILVHGGCTSSGCFALTNPVIKEVHELAQLARDHGQEKFAIHVFPFKLTKANLQRHKNSPWTGFWNNLKEGYDLFENNRTLPNISVCNKRYVFALNGQTEAAADSRDCYGLQAFIPGWHPARRIRRASRRGCNRNRASCRKFLALKRRKARSRRHRRYASKRRRAHLRGARGIGRKKSRVHRKRHSRKKRRK